MFRSCVAAFIFLFSIAGPAQAGLLGEDPKKMVDYSPASALVVHGAVQIGSFTYLPAVAGKLKPYALSNTSLADIVLTKDVADLIRESLLKEFRFIGFGTDGGPVLSGEIREFKYDDLGSNLITLTIHYSVKDAQGMLLYDAEKSSKQPLGTGNASPLNYTMTKNFEALVRDPDFLKAISGVMGISPPYVEGPSQYFAPLSYAPSSAFIAGGAVGIGAFEYQRDAKIEADQIRNTALGDIHLDRTVSTYFAEAMQKEFRLTGVNVESKDRIVSGTIVDIFCDDLGYSATWTLKVRYVVRDDAGSIIYESEKFTKQITPKSLIILNGILRSNFEELLLDEAFLRSIGSPPHQENVAQTVVPYDGWDGGQWSSFGPRSALVAHGSVSVGAFAYPVATGKIKSVQIPNRALLKNVYADRPIAEIMHDLTLKEFRFTGIDVRGSDRMLTGEIQKYKVDDISSPAEWQIAVHFVVKDKAGATLYDAVKSATPTNDQHLVNFQEMKVIIESLIADPEFVKVIN